MPVEYFPDRTVKAAAHTLLQHAADHAQGLDRGHVDDALMTYGAICRPFHLDPHTQSGLLCWDLAEFFIDRYAGLLEKRLMLPALLVSADTRLPGYYDDPEHGFWAKVFQLELVSLRVPSPAADKWLQEQQRSIVRAARFLADTGELDRLLAESRT